MALASLQAQAATLVRKGRAGNEAETRVESALEAKAFEESWSDVMRNWEEEDNRPDSCFLQWLKDEVVKAMNDTHEF